jgi:hypothetical protein
MPFKIILRHTIDDQALALIDRFAIDLVPKLRLE